MQRVISSSILLVIGFVAIASAIYFFRNYSAISGGKPEEAIPADAAFYVKVNHDFINNVQSAPWWNILKQNESIALLNQWIERLDSMIQTNENLRKTFAEHGLFLSVSATRSDNFDVLILMSINFRMNEVESKTMIEQISGIQDLTMHERHYEETDLFEIDFRNDLKFTFAQSKNVFLGSFTSFLVEDAIRQQKIWSGTLKSIRKIAGEFNRTESEKKNSFVIHFRNLPQWLSIFGKPEKRNVLRSAKNFAAPSSFDFNADENGIFLNGTLAIEDSLQFASLIAKQNPVKLSITEILPLKTAEAAVIAADFNDWFLYEHAIQGTSRAEKLAIIKKKYGIDAEKEILKLKPEQISLLITEPAGINFSGNTYFILKAGNGINALEVLSGISNEINRSSSWKTSEELYSGTKIGLLRANGMIPALFGERFQQIQNLYYAVINNNVFFANQPSSIRNIVDELNSGNLLLKNPSFRGTLIKMNQTGNYFYYARQQQSRYLLQSYLSESWNKKLIQQRNLLSGWKSFSVHIKGGTASPETRIEFRYDQLHSGERAAMVWSVQLDTAASTRLYCLSGPSASGTFALVQDEWNNLYKINSSGDIIFKTNTGGKIISAIHAIDLYRNNNVQYIFNTTERLMAVDKDGIFLHNFPIRLPAPASAGLTLADFDLNRKYTILIPCTNGMIYAYEGSGKPISDWYFRATPFPIAEPVNYFRFQNHDFLMCSDTAGNVNILNRNGSEVIKATGKVFRKNDTPFFGEYSSTGFRWVTLSENGLMTFIPESGEIEVHAHEAAVNAEKFILHQSSDSSVLYLFLEENALSSWNEKFESNFNIEVSNEKFQNFTVQYMDGNPVILLNSVYSNKTYLYTIQGELISGFPVKGGFGSVISDLNNDGKLYLITLGENGNIYAYSLQQ